MKSIVLGLVLALSIGSLFAPADDIHVVELTREGWIYVSLTFTSGFTDDMRAALRSGLPTAITYEIELRREVPVWFDRTLMRVTVTATAKYDNLTRQHQLSRDIDGRGEEPVFARDEEVVREWLTSLERLKLFKTTPALEPNVEYYIQVRARSTPRTGSFFLWPFDRGTAAGAARFTFIPS
jgi:Domain of unknown function (DUF4390)